jgi:truncated hemoglobin YjbI
VSIARLKALFLKIGGEKKVGEILNDFYHRMAQDILIGYFFNNKDIDAVAAKQKEFLLYAVGIRQTYEGKTPTSAHLELPSILTGHFDRRLVLLQETLKSHGLNPEDIQTWIDFEEAFRNVVVKK